MGSNPLGTSKILNTSPPLHRPKSVVRTRSQKRVRLNRRNPTSQSSSRSWLSWRRLQYRTSTSKKIYTRTHCRVLASVSLPHTVPSHLFYFLFVYMDSVIDLFPSFCMLLYYPGATYSGWARNCDVAIPGQDLRSSIFGSVFSIGFKGENAYVATAWDSRSFTSRRGMFLRFGCGGSW